MNTLHLEILTPYGSYLLEEVEYLEIRNSDGVIGILPHHTPIISTVKVGMIRIKMHGKMRKYATDGGILNVKPDGTVILMLQTIERDDEIDVERAKAALRRALARIETNDGDIERAQKAVMRATNRLKIAEGIIDE